jgi:hypothetical protein
VRVRPLQASALRPYLWMADEAWYDPASRDADFLVLDSQLTNGANWPWREITAQFGRPARVYRTGPFTVLVWRHNLLTTVVRPPSKPAVG